MRYLEENMGFKFENIEENNDGDIKGTVNSSKDKKSFTFRFMKSNKPHETWHVDYHERRTCKGQETGNSESSSKANSNSNSQKSISKVDFDKRWKQQERQPSTKQEDLLKEHIVHEMDPQTAMKLIEMYANANDDRARQYLKGMKDVPAMRIGSSRKNQKLELVKRCKLSQAA
jgi:hypothetical protein